MSKAHGYGCGYVYSVGDGTGETLLTQGVSDAEWIGLTDQAIFVLGGDGMCVEPIAERCRGEFSGRSIAHLRGAW